MSPWQARRSRISRKQRATRPHATRLTTMRPVNAEVIWNGLQGSPGVRGEAERHEPARKSARVKSQRAAEPNECGLRCGRRDHESVEL